MLVTKILFFILIMQTSCFAGAVYSPSFNELLKDLDSSKIDPPDNFDCTVFCLKKRVKIIDQMRIYAERKNLKKEQTRKFKPELDELLLGCEADCKYSIIPEPSPSFLLKHDSN
jgi:uncharacterized protein (DUF2461 family)